MKSFIAIFAVIAAVSADVSHLVNNEYLPPVQQYGPGPVAPVHYGSPVPNGEYLPPLQVVEEPVVPGHELTDDGYVYKNPVEERRRAKLRRYRLRHRNRRF